MPKSHCVYDQLFDLFHFYLESNFFEMEIGIMILFNEINQITVLLIFQKILLHLIVSPFF